MRLTATIRVNLPLTIVFPTSYNCSRQITEQRSFLGVFFRLNFSVKHQQKHFSKIRLQVHVIFCNWSFKKSLLICKSSAFRNSTKIEQKGYSCIKAYLPSSHKFSSMAVNYILTTVIISFENFSSHIQRSLQNYSPNNISTFSSSITLSHF